MKKGFEKSWLLVFITMCTMTIFAVVAGSFELKLNTYAFTLATEGLIIIPCLLGIIMLGKSFFKDQSFYKGIELSAVPIFVILPFFSQKFFLQMLLPLQTLLYEFVGEMPKTVDVAGSVGEFFAQVMVMCLVPALIEEFLCRGVIMHMLKPYGMVVSMVVSALAFSVLHFDIASFLIIFMMGMLLSAVKIFTGSFWACVLLHFSNNFTAIINNLLMTHEIIKPLYYLSFLSLALFPLCMIFLLKKYKKNVIGMKNEKSEKPKFSIGLCACAVFFIINAIVKH